MIVGYSALHFKNDRNFGKKSILFLCFKPVTCFKGNFIKPLMKILVFRIKCSNTAIFIGFRLADLNPFSFNLFFKRDLNIR